MYKLLKLVIFSLPLSQALWLIMTACLNHHIKGHTQILAVVSINCNGSYNRYWSTRSLDNTMRHMAKKLTMQSYNYRYHNSNITKAAVQRTATQLLKSYFSAAHCFINMPVFIYAEHRIVVQLFYYVSANVKPNKLSSNLFVHAPAIGRDAQVSILMPNTKNNDNAYRPNPAINSNSVQKGVIAFNPMDSTHGSSNYGQGCTASEKLNSPALKTLGTALARLFSGTGFSQKRINISPFSADTNECSTPSVELRIVRLHQPYLNSSILAQYLAVNASKYGFARLRQSLLSAIPLGQVIQPGLSSLSVQSAPNFTGAKQYASVSLGLENEGYAKGPNNTTTGIPVYAILGIKVQLSGLLTTQRNAPRKTVSTVSVGTFHNTAINGGSIIAAVDYASSTSKSTIGAYTVKV